MSDHAWVAENVASYVAGGLDAEERELLDEHVAGCADCARLLDEARTIDRDLGALFAPVRPNPALEDRSIQVLRQTSARRRGFRLSRRGKIGLAVAAAVFFAAVGTVVSALDEQSTATASKHFMEIGLAHHGANDTYHSRRDRAEAPGFKLGVDLVGGTDLTDLGTDIYYPVETPESLARELREKTTFRLEVRTPPGGGAEKSVVESMDGSVASLARGYAGTLTKEGLKDAGGRSDSLGDDRQKGRGLARGATPQIKSFKPGEVFARKGEPAEGKDTATKSGTESVNGREPVLKLKMSGATAHSLGFKHDPAAGDVQKLGEDKEPAKTEPAPVPAGRKIIRSGEIDFEINSFDDAVAVITRLVAATRTGFIATVNSDKLPNGKVRGSVVVRVPPDKLDGLVLDLRKELGKIGELKGQRIGSKDISKEYTDLESRLRAAHTMEERLLKIIKEGKGQIKDLLLAEKELGNWRTQIEQMEGELRYYANLVSLSTLTILLTEKEIRQAASITESERVNAGIEVEDVEKAFRDAQDAIAEAKGRVTRSDLKQHAAGQFNAVLNFEVAPEAAGTIRDRLRQLGTMVRLDIDRVQQAEGGTLTLRDGKVTRGPTQFMVSLYNLATVAPRETVTLKVAAADVAAAYRKLRAAVEQAKGRVSNAQLNEQDRQNITAQLDFDVRRADEGALQAALAEAGEALSRQVTQLPAGENVTNAKVQFKVELVNAENVPPRETTTLGVEVADVEAAQAVITAQVRDVHGRTVHSQLGQERNGRITAHLVFDVPLAAAPAVIATIEAAGQVRVLDVKKNAQAPEGKLALARLDVVLANAELLVPGDSGLWAQVRNGLSLSLRGLAGSAMLVIVGVLVVLPWALVICVIVWLVRRLWRSTGGAPLPLTAAARLRVARAPTT